MEGVSVFKARSDPNQNGKLVPYGQRLTDENLTGEVGEKIRAAVKDADPAAKNGEVRVDDRVYLWSRDENS